MATQADADAFIRERSAATGSLAAALREMEATLQSPELRQCAVDVFPASRLAGAVTKLCRCRGMIQEVQPEINLFCGAAGHFFSPAPTAVDEASSGPVEFVDTVSLYVIPVPGNDHFYETGADAPLTEAARSSSADEAHAQRKRRERDEQATSTLPPPLESAGTQAATERDAKVAKRGEGPRLTSCAPASASAATVGGLNLNLPHPSRHPQLQAACIVTVLLPAAPSTGSTGAAEQRRNPFRINDVVDFFGYQHFPNDQLPVNEEDDFARFSAWNAAELSKGLVSRLLCVSYAPVCSVHLPCTLSSAAMDAAAFAQHRSAALRFLSERLTRGDDLAAEYVLLHLCARVSVHSDALPVGDLPLLVSSPEICPAAWSSQLRSIVPVAEVLLDSATLRAEAARLTPRYNNELNYLQSGALQVANGSHVTVDCAELEARDGDWYEGMFALVHKQLLLLEYPFQTLELPVDVSVLALTKHEDLSLLHPLFQFALRVRWEPTQLGATPDRPAADTATGLAELVRRYLCAVRQMPARPEEVEEGTATLASTALLEMTQEMPQWNNRDPLLHNNSFSVATALMRAHAASYGRSSFTATDIAAVRGLERARVARLSTAAA